MSMPKLLGAISSEAGRIAFSKLITTVTAVKSGTTIVVNETIDVMDQCMISYKTPCACIEVTSITINNILYTMKDVPTYVGLPTGAYPEGTIVMFLIDVPNKVAYLQNPAITNHILNKFREIENTLSNKSSKSVVVKGFPLLKTNWVNKKYTYTNSAITATNVVEMYITYGNSDEQIEAFQDANIIGGIQKAGSIELLVKGYVPTVNISVDFVIRGDS